MGGIAQEGVHEAHRLRTLRVEGAAGLLVAADDVARVEAGEQPPVPGEDRAEVRRGGIGGLVLLVVAVEDLVEPAQGSGCSVRKWLWAAGALETMLMPPARAGRRQKRLT
jgi:hypothetical protein